MKVCLLILSAFIVMLSLMPAPVDARSGVAVAL
jgi:hypothetical protein